MDVILVGVNTDGEFLQVGGGLEDAHAGTARCGEDDVRAAVELGAGQFTGLDRVAPGCRSGAGHVLKYLNVLVRILCAFLVAQGELADQGHIHAAHESDLAGLRLHGRQHAHQEGAFVFLEDDGLDIGQSPPPCPR